MNRKDDYVLAVKENHPTLYRQVSRLMDEACPEKFASVQHDPFSVVNKGHGRLEVRRVYCNSELVRWVSQRAQWGDSKASSCSGRPLYCVVQMQDMAAADTQTIIPPDAPAPPMTGG